jgi:hypothetical protein
MKKVSICYIAKNDYWSAIYSFERIGFAIVEEVGEFIINEEKEKKYIKVIGNVEVELLVAFLPTTDLRLVDYFSKLTLLTETHQTEVSDAIAYNGLFKKANHDYICLLNDNVFLQEHWLTELIYHYENIHNSGIVSICDNFTDVNFLPTLTIEKETLTNVFIPTNNMVKGNSVSIFLKEYLNYIGCFDQSVELYGNELNQLQLRFVASGYINYYIPTQTALVLQDNQKVNYNKLDIGNKNLPKTIAEMKKLKNYYIPL